MVDVHESCNKPKQCRFLRQTVELRAHWVAENIVVQGGPTLACKYWTSPAWRVVGLHSVGKVCYWRLPCFDTCRLCRKQLWCLKLLVRWRKSENWQSQRSQAL